LISFYNERKKEKTLLLIDCAVINAGKIKNISENALMKIDKTWNDVITISTDSASYMKKLYDAESLFSKLRDIQDSKRTRLSCENIAMERIMYLNDDIEE